MRMAPEPCVQRVYRHRNSRGHLLHLTTNIKSDNYYMPCQDACALEDVLLLDVWDVLLMASSPDPYEMPIELLPTLVYVGQFSNGQDAYLAQGFVTHVPFCLNGSGSPEPPLNTFAVILRYPFSTFDASYLLDEQSGEECDGDCMDPTGPYSWRFVRYLPGALEMDEDQYNGIVSPDETSCVALPSSSNTEGPEEMAQRWIWTIELFNHGAKPLRSNSQQNVFEKDRPSL